MTMSTENAIRDAVIKLETKMEVMSDSMISMADSVAKLTDLRYELLAIKKDIDALAARTVKSEDQIDISQSAGGKELSRHCGHERAAQGERERQREEERERESFCESEQERVCVIVCDCVCVCVCARARVCHPLTRPTSPTHSLTNKHTQGRRGSKI